MRWLRGGLLILPALLSLVNLALLVRSLFTNDILERITTSNDKRLIGVMSWNGKLSYRVVTAPLNLGT
jgi:hypothetical protein